MGVDVADTSVPVNVVGTEQQVVQPKGKHAVCVSRSVPDIERFRAESQRVTFVDGSVERKFWKIDRNILRRNFSVCHDAIAILEQSCRFRVPDRFGLWQQFFGSPQTLNVVNVRVCRNEVTAVRQGEIHLSDEFDDLVNGVFVTDVNEHPVRAVEHKIDAAAEPLSRLIIHFDDVRKNFRAINHGDFDSSSGL